MYTYLYYIFGSLYVSVYSTFAKFMKNVLLPTDLQYQKYEKIVFA